MLDLPTPHSDREKLVYSHLNQSPSKWTSNESPLTQCLKFITDYTNLARIGTNRCIMVASYPIHCCEVLYHCWPHKQLIKRNRHSWMQNYISNRSFHRRHSRCLLTRIYYHPTWLAWGEQSLVIWSYIYSHTLIGPQRHHPYAKIFLRYSVLAYG